MSHLAVQQEGMTRNNSCPTVTYLNVFPNANEKQAILQEGGKLLEPCETIREEKLYTGKYLELKKYHFRDAQGKERSAEGVHMVKNNSESNPKNGNGVNKVGNLCTIAVVRRQIMCDCLVLVKQYRAPLKAYTIEFPATVLVDKENPEDVATKEIADDTGYRSVNIRRISPLTSLEPDISDGKLQIVSMNIDGDDPMQYPMCNNNNQSTGGNQGAHGDIVEVIKVPINGLIERLEKYDQQGTVVDSRVYAFAIGLMKGAHLLKATTVIESEQPM